MTFDVDGDADQFIKVDMFRIGIIFNNLISNAIKYSDLHKPQRHVRLTVRRSVNGLLLVVRDNGQGIQKQHRARVFDMFYRASDHSYGSGLGLYIVKQAVDRLGGVIILDTEEGAGTTVTITFPLAG
jgi:signal transduction histidine kinase